MKNFRSTYRLQLSKEFTLNDATHVAAYIADLGVSHLYLSPILESVPGSSHGYDGTDPTQISLERGGEKAFDQLVQRVRKTPGLEGIVLDIVPNHLATHATNPAWWDLLKNGKDSWAWKVFDVKEGEKYKSRVVLPVLGRSHQAVLASRQLKLGFENKELILKYFDKKYPLSPKSLPYLLMNLVDSLGATTTLKNFAIKAALTLKRVPPGLYEDLAKNKKLLADLQASFDRLPVKTLETLLDQQNYILREWRTGQREINYRRFFDINDLAGIRIEDPEVFNWDHKKIKELVKKYPEVQGLRVDHIDGLAYPGSYLEKLNEILPAVWVEKILADKETLPDHWQTLGSTGYEFSVISARLFVQVQGILQLHSHYLEHIDDRWQRFHDCVYDSKREMLQTYFSSELEYLVRHFYALVPKSLQKNFSEEDLYVTLLEITSSLRIYRTYAVKGKPLKSAWLQDALSEAESRGRLGSVQAFEWFKELLEKSGRWSDKEFSCIKRWEQLTGPVMAKGLEDTALYRYCPLLSLNGVGGEPDWIGDGSLEYHRFQTKNFERYPYNLNTTSTHDTKRSEDVRSRIHVLSELSSEWIHLWERLQNQFVSHDTPTKRSMYLIFETIIGAWPFEGEIDDQFVQRMKDYFIKSAREAKTETSWADIDEAYEKSLQDFIESLLKPQTLFGKRFLKTLSEFAMKCSYYGAFNSLSLVIIKITSRGVCDFYQGCELWDLSLVDPDNRRAVDYKLRNKLLQDIRTWSRNPDQKFVKDLHRQWRNGQIKLWMTHLLLVERNRNPELFIHGKYIPLKPQGKAAMNYLAFAREHEGQWFVVVVPRLLSAKEKFKETLSIKNSELLDFKVTLPKKAPRLWCHVLTKEEISLTEINGSLLQSTPFLVLKSK